MTINIQEASLQQLEEIVPLFDQYMVFYEKPSNPKKYKQFLHDRLSNKESTIFLAYQGNKAVGFTQIYYSFSSVSLGRTLILNDLYVHPDARKLGIGEKLIQATFELAKKTGAIRVDLETAEDNHSAQRLYERIGFVKGEGYWDYSYGFFNG